MSVILQDAVVQMLRTAFTRQEVADVRAYAGEFGGGEIGKVSFAAPALLVACLGWRPAPSGLRLVGRRVRGVRMAVFVVTKGAGRDERAREAAVLAERVQWVVEDWLPEAHDALEMAAVEPEGATVENLYSRAMDANGMALWLVDWTQAVMPLLPPAQAGALLAVDIASRFSDGVGTPLPPAGAVVVRHSIDVDEGQP